VALVTGQVDSTATSLSSLVEEVIVVNSSVNNILILRATAKAVEEAIRTITKTHIITGLTSQVTDISHCKEVAKQGQSLCLIPILFRILLSLRMGRQLSGIICKQAKNWEKL
jgi:hypothetical protein